MGRITEVVKNLILINVLIYVIVHYNLIPIPGFEKYFILYSPSTGQFEPIQIITHMFMHGNFMHLLFNMIGLFFLGPWVESSLGPKRFIILYMACGLFAAVAQMFVSQGAMVGASGAVYGVLAAFATMFPNVRLMLLFPPIPIKAKYMALGLIVLGVYYEVTGGQQGIGHLAHIGGAVLGYILVRFVWKMNSLR